MRTLARPPFVIRRPVAALRQQWPLAVADDVEGIHQTRVASRRLREWVPVLAPDPIPREPAALRRRLRDVTRMLGPSRELDVAGMSLAAIAKRAPERAAAVALVKAHVERERARAGRVRRQQSGTVDIEDLATRTDRLAGLDRSPAAIRGCATRAAARLDHRARQLQQALLGAGLVFAPGPLHRVRIALKKFRYALEVAERLGRFNLAGSLQRLKRMQNLLGDLHDLQVLAGHARDATALAPAVRRAPIDALVGDIDATIRGLHSRFVTERGSLVAVLARATYVRDMLETLPAPGDAKTRKGRRTSRPSRLEDR